MKFHHVKIDMLITAFVFALVTFLFVSSKEKDVIFWFLLDSVHEETKYGN